MSRTARSIADLVGVLVVILGVRSAAAQPGRRPPAVDVAPRVRPEFRIDGFAGHASGAQLGLGAAVDAGTYVRFAVVAAAGTERRTGGAWTGVQRAEGVMRFYVDPFREYRRGWYVAGGAGARHVAGEPVRPVLVALFGMEGAARHGTAVAVEAGVGGGARLGIAVRRSRAGRR